MLTAQEGGGPPLPTAWLEEEEDGADESGSAWMSEEHTRATVGAAAATSDAWKFLGIVSETS